MRSGLPGRWSDPERVALYDLVIPLPAGKQEFENSLDVFKAAVLRRKKPFALAVLATLVVNLIALVTDLSRCKSMTVLSRAVPSRRSGCWPSVRSWRCCSDYALRVIRADVLEQEAVQIDTEVCGVLLLARRRCQARCATAVDRYDGGTAQERLEPGARDDFLGGALRARRPAVRAAVHHRHLPAWR